MAQPSAPQFPSSQAFISVRRWPKPPCGTPTLIRPGKRRLAEIIMSRGLLGMPCSSFVLVNDGTVAYHCPEHKQTTASYTSSP